MKRKLVWSLFVCILFSQDVFPQQAAIITILSDSNTAVEHAVIVLKALDQHVEKKQVQYYTTAQGQIVNNYPYKASIFVRCLGYQSYEGFIEANQSDTIHLLKSVIDLNDVVVTGQYDVNTSDKSVYNIKVLDQKTIHLMGAQNLPDLLSNQLNMRLSQDNILGSSVSINGVSGQNVKILVDGVPVIGRENGNIDLSQMNLNNVERVEIVEGPMSVMYGTDALGGAINLITRKSSSYPLEGDVNLHYESDGTYNADGAFLWRKSKHALTLSGGRYFFDGFSENDTSRYQEWKPRLQYFGALNYNFNATNFNLGVSSNYYNEEIQNKGAPVITPYQAYAFDDYYFTRRLDETITAEFRLKNPAKIQLINAWSNYRRIKNTYRKDLVTLDELLTADPGSQDTTMFDAFNFRGAYISNLPSRKINFQAGYDVNLQSGSGEELKSGVQRINDYAAFGSLEYKPIEAITIRPGLRATYNTRYGAPLTPSINFKYDFLNDYSLRASYARGFRAPSLKELDLYFVDVNHNIVGNPFLEAETSNNFNLSFTAKNLLPESSNYSLKFDASLFFNDIKNIITLALVDTAINQYTYVNIDRFKSTGATFTASLRLKNFSMVTGFSLLGTYDTLSSKYNVSKFSLSPEFQTNFSFTFPKPQLEVALFLKNTGTTPGFNVDAKGNVYETSIQSYTIADASLTKYFFQKKIACTAGVKNIFNVTDIQSNAAAASFHSSGGDTIPYGTGRLVFVSVRIKLFKEE